MRNGMLKHPMAEHEPARDISGRPSDLTGFQLHDTLCLVAPTTLQLGWPIVWQRHGTSYVQHWP